MQHKHNITIIGAITSGRLFTRLAPRTNQETVHAFFEQMAEEHDLSGAVVVLDNHLAHKAVTVKRLLEELGCELLFLPPASSRYCILETVFIKMKPLVSTN